MHDLDGGAQQRLRQREHSVFKGRDTRGDAGGRLVDSPGHHLLSAGCLALHPAVDQAHPVVLVVEPFVEAFEPCDELAVERTEPGGQAVDGGGQPVDGRRHPGHARLVHRVKPQADLLQCAGDRPLLHDVIVHRTREQFAHPVSGRVLSVARGRSRLGGAQQQVAARLIHSAPSCAKAWSPQN